MTLDELNATRDFPAALSGVFEHAPWVAQRAAAKRPFQTIAALHEALMAEVVSAPELLAFLNAHPELAASKLPTNLTAESAHEQTGLGMATAPGAKTLPTLNKTYRDRFGFPFIICVARHTAENVLRNIRTRLTHTPDQERAAALAEIAHITRLRLLAKLDLPPPAGHLSTHVLDTSIGRPVADLTLTLHQEGRPVATATTNQDGRATGLLPPGPLRQGRYELLFDVAPYFAATNTPTFFDQIPIRFRIDDAEGRYHVPLLLAPYFYSVYRGS